MFAVVSSDDRMPVFVKKVYVGFWPCEPDNILGWALLHSKQGEVVTEAALRGSMVGWDNPAARAAIQWEVPFPLEDRQASELPTEQSDGVLPVPQLVAALYDSTPPLSKISGLAGKCYPHFPRFCYGFEPIDWFDARTGHKRVGLGCSSIVKGSPNGDGDVWRNSAREMVGRMTTQGHRFAFKIKSAAGGPVFDQEIDEICDDVMNLMALWIMQGAEEWPDWQPYNAGQCD